MIRVRQFAERQGKIVFVPADSPGFTIGIKSTDECFPVSLLISPISKHITSQTSIVFTILQICPDGLGRSQVMHLVLKGIKRAIGTSTGVALPHGAESGYDCSVDNSLLNTFIYPSKENSLENSFKIN
jgi:hypothetical protein